LQVLLEFQRDWSRKEHYEEVMAVVKEHCGAYGQGIEMPHDGPKKRRPGGTDKPQILKQYEYQNRTNRLNSTPTAQLSRSPWRLRHPASHA